MRFVYRSTKARTHALTIFNALIYSTVGRDSSVGIATRYGLEGPWIESRWGARFSAPVQTGTGAYPASCTMGTGSFLGVKLLGRGAYHPPPSKCRGQERVGLYLYSPSGPSWLVMGAPLPFRRQIGYANARQCYVIRALPVLFTNFPIRFLIVVAQWYCYIKQMDSSLFAYYMPLL